jgi:hypothetical protein
MTKKVDFMAEFPENIGKLLIFVGLVLAGIGVLVLLLGNLGLFRLPGDLKFGGENWKVYVPIASCVLLSIVLTLIMWIINYIRR